MLDPLISGGLVGVGIVLLIIEVLAPGRTFMAIPGSFLAILGAIGLFTKDETFTFGIGIMIAAIVAVAAAFITSSHYNRRHRGDTKGKAGSLIGRTGKVTKRIPSNGIGGVRIDRTTWKAKADESIGVGTTVEVVDMKGIHLIVVESDDTVESGEEE